MIAAIAFGLLIGLALGALGGGGSILAVPVLVHVGGQSASAATATSLVAVGAAAAAAAVGHARKGNVQLRPALIFIVTGIPGAWVGTRLNATLDDQVLLLGFSGLVLLATHRMLTACPTCTRVGEQRALADDPAGRATRSPLTVLAAGTAVGVLTGLFGVGGGFVIVPALTLALGLSMPVAIGTSLLVIVGNATVALGFRGLDAVDWELAVPFTATMLVGSVAGAAIGPKLPVETSLRAFAALLVVVAVGTGLSAAVSLAT